MKNAAAFSFLLALFSAGLVSADDKAPLAKTVPASRVDGAGAVLSSSIDRQVSFLMIHREALGLTKEQTDSLQTLVQDGVRNRLRQGQVMRELSEGLQSRLDRDQPDIEGSKAFIDTSFASLAETARFNVDAIARIHQILTPEQMAKAKKLRDELRAQRANGQNLSRPKTAA